MIHRCSFIDARLCTQRDFLTEWLCTFAKRMGIGLRLHRKVWELAAIAHVLAERGMLREGTRGLGFGVGTDPLTSFFASAGCAITATDLDPSSPEVAKWVPTGQHAAGLAATYHPPLISRADFDKRVEFCAVDMRAVPEDLTGYDFLWSCSALEHLGSLAAGARFLIDSLKCLRPGGVAVHTTEHSISDIRTLNHGPVVAYRRRDMDGLLRGLVTEGGTYSSDWYTGHGVADLDVDEAPYRSAPHLKLRVGGVVIMSVLVTMVRADS